MQLVDVIVVNRVTVFSGMEHRVIAQKSTLKMQFADSCSEPPQADSVLLTPIYRQNQN